MNIQSTALASIDLSTAFNLKDHKVSLWLVCSVIAQSSKVRDLGVIYDQLPNFDDYISGVCRSTHFHLRNIGRIRHLISYDAYAQMINALILICLDYCNSVLYNLPKGSIERLQKIQNQALI